ncbi:MAG: ROK family protein, partial [Brevefilum sp.]
MSDVFSRRPDGRRIGLRSDEGIILKSLFSRGPQSRNDLALETQFSRSKVSHLVKALLTKQIVQEIDRTQGNHSKRKKLTINPNLGLLVAVDIGTTSVDVAVADCSCDIIGHESALLNVNEGPERVLHQAVVMMEDIIRHNHLTKDKILGIGIGVPGPVNYPSGEVLGGQFTPGWEGH